MPSLFNEIFKHLFQCYLVINNVVLEKPNNMFIEIKRENKDILVKLVLNKCEFSWNASFLGPCKKTLNISHFGMGVVSSFNE